MSTNPDGVRRIAYLQRTSDMAKSFMQKVFGTTPQPLATGGDFSPLLHADTEQRHCSRPVLLVRPTEGGKSSVRDVFSVMNGGFSLTITPLLSLGADQEEKITLKAKQTSGTVLSVHLDEIWSLADQQQLIKHLQSISQDFNTAVVSFSSPQAILSEKFLWQSFINWLIVNQ